MKKLFVLIITLLLCNVVVAQVRFNPVANGTSNLYQQTNQYKIGLCGTRAFSSTMVPEANLQIDFDSLSLLPTKPLLITSMSNGGRILYSIKFMYRNGLINYGIHQSGDMFLNRFEGRIMIGSTPSGTINDQVLVDGSIALKRNLTFYHNDAHLYNITIDNIDADDIFKFTFSHPYNNLANPLLLDPMSGVITHGLFVADRVKFINGAGENKILVSASDGTGVWTNASLFNDNDWLVRNFGGKNGGEAALQDLYQNPDYRNVGIGTTEPASKLHVAEGNILISGGGEGDAYGIQFGKSISANSPEGEWKIAYKENEMYPLGATSGLDFWKLPTNINPSVNHCLFIKNNGDIGVNTATPIAKLHVNGTGIYTQYLGVNIPSLPVEALQINSGISSVAIGSGPDNVTGLGYMGFNISRSTNSWNVGGDNFKNNGTLIYNTANGNLSFCIVPSSEPFTERTLTQAELDDHTTMVVTDGTVGIGTFSPQATLDVKNKIQCFSTSGNPVLFRAKNPAYTLSFGVDANGNGHIYESDQDNVLMTFKGGKVGVGSDAYNLTSYTGNSKLFVEGGITTEEIIVKVKDDWADFVFDQNYKLRSLYELENYINNNRHLPDIPSEKEIKSYGVDLAKMNESLLQKVEELTLYVIQLKKEIDELRNR